MLSKSRYLKGLKCTKALWLNKYKKEEVYYPESTLQVFATGNTAGDLAQQYFPNGELALVSDYPDSKAIARTKELITNGETTIYEATFAAESTLVALDVLHKIDGKWHAFEVKSTNSVKQEHIRDAAIQYYVMTNAGIEIEDISIMHFDKTYVRNGELNPKELFTYESVINRIEPYLADIPANINRFLDVYKSEEPTVLIDTHCKEPYECEFANYCHQLPENKGLINVEETQKSTDVNYKNDDEIQHFLKQHSYPIYSFDFETIMYGIPEFNQSRPYQQIPFQYSLHFQKDANTEPEHFEFLGNGVDDPREELIKSMIKNFKNKGSILVYSITFERTRIYELIRDFPVYEHELTFIANRLVDLAPIYRKHIKTEITQKKWSLKVVLPTFLPQFSYENLDIQDGMATMDIYRNLSNLSQLDLIEARRNMLEYCKLYTLAVLELYRILN